MENDNERERVFHLGERIKTLEAWIDCVESYVTEKKPSAFWNGKRVPTQAERLEGIANCLEGMRGDYEEYLEFSDLKQEFKRLF